MMVLKVIGLARGHSGVRRDRRRAAARSGRGGRPAGHSRAGVGRRLGRSRPARPYERRADRRGPDRARRRGPARRRGAGPARAGAAGARPEGRAGADQRHPGLDRDRARRPVHRRAGVRRGPGRRRAVDRRAQGHRRRLRSAHPRGARPARPDRGRRVAAARLLDGQRDPATRTPIATRCRIPTASAASRR